MLYTPCLSIPSSAISLFSGKEGKPSSSFPSLPFCQCPKRKDGWEVLCTLMLHSFPGNLAFLGHGRYREEEEQAASLSRFSHSLFFPSSTSFKRKKERCSIPWLRIPFRYSQLSHPRQVQREGWFTLGAPTFLSSAVSNKEEEKDGSEYTLYVHSFSASSLFSCTGGVGRGKGRLLHTLDSNLRRLNPPSRAVKQT